MVGSTTPNYEPLEEEEDKGKVHAKDSLTQPRFWPFPCCRISNDRLGLFQAMVLICTIVVTSIVLLARTDLSELGTITLDRVATSPLLPTWVLLLVRASFFAITLQITIQLWREPNPTVVKPADVAITLHRWSRFTTFTTWSWVYLCVLCGLTTMASLLHIVSLTLPQPLLSFAWVSFEVLWSCSSVVSFFSNCVLLPGAYLRGNKEVVRLFLTFRGLMQHVFNMIILSWELVFSKLTLEPEHVPFINFFPCAYMIFGWFWFHQTGVFYYFVLDYRMPCTILLHLIMFGLNFLAFLAGRAVQLAILS